SRFGCDECAAVGLDDTMVVEGPEAGVHLALPALRNGLSAWIRGGIIQQTIAFSGFDDRMSSRPAVGFSGAAALDREGRLLGIAIHKSSVMAGIADAPQAAMVPLAKIKSFLEANHIAATAGHPGIEDAKASVVRVICVRK
ncbi:MAG: hypothetical protein WEA28_01950, partial [Xanthobacteraceae bacterium]